MKHTLINCIDISIIPKRIQKIISDVGDNQKLDKNFNMNNPFMKKLPKGTEAANIMVGGELEDLDQSVMAFIRLTDGVRLGDMTEVPIPTRFLFILLGPSVSLNHLRGLNPQKKLSTMKQNNLWI